MCFNKKHFPHALDSKSAIFPFAKWLFVIFGYNSDAIPVLGKLTVSALDITLSLEETSELKRRVRSAIIPQRRSASRETTLHG